MLIKYVVRKYAKRVDAELVGNIKVSRIGNTCKIAQRACS